MYVPPKERIGLLTLVLLIVLIHSFSYLHRELYEYSDQEKTQLVADILVQQKELQSKQKSTSLIKKSTPDPKIAQDLRSVHMSKASLSELLELGFSKFAANNIIKYRSKGGKFTKTQDLQKIYGVNADHLTEIEDYIIFERMTKSSVDTPSKQRNKEVSIKPTTASAPVKEIKTISSWDPNNASQDVLIAVGFSPYAANNLIKYRSKGGQIKRQEDLLKVYGLDSLSYRKVAKSMTIGSAPSEGHKDIDSSYNTYSKVSTQSRAISINTTEAQSLEVFRGIGPTLSKRIIKYRDRLGGFIHSDQLYEVYGLPREVVDSIIPHIIISGAPRKLFPPAIDFKKVLSHPYIDYETTKMLKNISILEYEEKIIYLLEQKKIDEKLIPYLETKDPSTTEKFAGNIR